MKNCQLQLTQIQIIKEFRYITVVTLDKINTIHNIKLRVDKKDHIKRF